VYRHAPPWAAVVLTVLSFCTESPAAPAPVRYELSHPALSTSFRVVVYCPDEASAAKAELVVVRRLAELEEALDAGRPSSDLSQVYANAGLGAVRVSDDLYALVRQADKLSGGGSGGAYDVTGGALTKLWRDSIEAGRMPTDADIAAARQLVGRDKLRLNPIDRTLHVTEPGVVLELDGVTAAYACDRLLAGLRRAGFASALVDAGDCVAAGDPPPGRKGWTIRINDAAAKAPHRFVTIARQAIASSHRLGDHVTLDGQTYSRLVHPLVGIGSRNVAPATVVAPSAWQAAILARAASVAGETDSRRLFRSMRGVKVLFHYPPGERPKPLPETAEDRRERGPQTLPFQPGEVREIRRTGTIRQ
jgi:thiamine biosynthesis lipoprotein